MNNEKDYQIRINDTVGCLKVVLKKNDECCAVDAYALSHVLLDALQFIIVNEADDPWAKNLKGIQKLLIKMMIDIACMLLKNKNESN